MKHIFGYNLAKRFLNGRQILLRCTLITVSSREIIVVQLYVDIYSMGQGFKINNFLNFPAFASAIFKDGNRQYKCHNISNTTSH